MPTMPCRDCKRPVSVDAEDCPNCGCHAPAVQSQGGLCAAYTAAFVVVAAIVFWFATVVGHGCRPVYEIFSQ